MPTIKPNKAEDVIGKIFKNEEAVYGLKESCIICYLDN